jgi:nucleoside-diphosphate-sugar epimerase
MKVLVVGASGGSGLATVRSLLSAGHEVTAFARQRARLEDMGEVVRFIRGDATDPAAIDRAVAGHDAVVITLGIRENALRVRLRGSINTPMNVRSVGTRHVVAAMHRHGIRRLVVQSSYGVGPTRSRLPLSYKLIFALLLKPQIADTHTQEDETRNSGLDWTIAQPVSLTDQPFDTAPYASSVGVTRSMRVSRNQVGFFLTSALGHPKYSQQTISLSAA